MKKIFITSLLCVMTFFSASADEYVYFFNVKATDNAEILLTIPLADCPVMTYENDSESGAYNMVVKSNDSEPVAFDTKDRYEFYYTKTTTSSVITSALSKSNFRKNGQVVTLSGIKANETVTVFAANGAQVATVSADTNGVAVIDLTSLPKGVVVLKSLGASFKLAH